MSDLKDFVIEDGVLRKYVGPGGDVVIPDGVTDIGLEAFKNCRNLTSVTMSDSVKKIWKYAFYGCSSLLNVNLSKNLTVISESAFSYCGISKITIPDNVIEIGSSAFYRCALLSNVTMPNSVKTIGESAFSYCGNLLNITIPDNITEIKKNTFHGCESLLGVSLPNSIKTIGESAFSYCKNLEKINIPDSVIKIEEMAFSYCNNLSDVNISSENKSFSLLDGILFNKDKTKIIYCPNVKTGTYTIPNNVTEICNYAFSGCSDLSDIIIPDSVTKIGNYAFQNCTKLTNIKIPSNVKKLGDYSFEGCKNLKSVIIPSTVPKFGFGVLPQNVIIITYAPIKLFAADFKPHVLLGFIEMINNGEIFPEETLNENLKYITNQRKKLYPIALENPVLLMYMIENKVIKLDEVNELINSKEIDLTSRAALMAYSESNYSQKQIDDYTNKTQGLLKMTATELKKIWTTSKNEDGTLTIIKYKGNNTNVIVPDMIGKSQVVKVGERAFSRCQDLISVTIPSGVTEIERNAFEYCSNLSSICISDGVTKIGKNAFMYCYSLINIDVSIDNKKFSSVDGALYSKDKTQLIVCPNGKAESYIVPDGVTKIHPFAFSECKYLKNIEIPDSVNTIGAGAFECCNALVGVVLPRNITVIEKGTFFDCENLTKVIIPDGVTEIKKYNFVDCGSLKNIGIPSSVIKIGEPSFAGCYDLTLHVPAGSYAEQYAKENNIPFVAE